MLFINTPTKGKRSATHPTSQAKNILYQALLIKPTFSLLANAEKNQFFQNYSYIHLTIIPRMLIGHELLDSGRGAEHRVGYHKLISNKRE